MSLSAREQQVLHDIEERLAGSDPKLASLLAMFTRLTWGEEMPIGEKIRAGWWRATSRKPARRHPPLAGASRHVCQPCRHVGWQRAMLLLWLLAVVALVATALTVNRSSGKWSCARPGPVTCASMSPVAPAAGPGRAGAGAAGAYPNWPGW